MTSRTGLAATLIGGNKTLVNPEIPGLGIEKGPGFGIGNPIVSSVSVHPFTNRSGQIFYNS